MSVRKVAATTAALGTAYLGVGAYQSHETAQDIRSQAAYAEAVYKEPTLTARIEGLADKEDLKTYSLLGMAVLLGAGTAVVYIGSAPKKGAEGPASSDSKVESV